METIIDGQTILIDDADAHLLRSHEWKVRPVGSSGKEKRYRLVWYEMVRRPDRTRNLITHQLHREMFPHHKGHISFANGNPFDLRRENIVLHETVVNKVTCPFSGERLRDMYWKLAWSTTQIGTLAAELLERPVPINEDTVMQWLRDAGISLRSKSERLKMRHAQTPHLFRQWRLKGVAINAERLRSGHTPSRVERMHTPRLKRKAKTAWKRSITHRFVEQKCRRPACKIILRRSKAQIARQPEAYCSRRCIGLDWKRIVREKQEQIVIPDWLQEILDKRKTQ